MNKSVSFIINELQVGYGAKPDKKALDYIDSLKGQLEIETKMDGMRGFLFKDPDSGYIKMLSSSGKPYKGNFSNIYKQLGPALKDGYCFSGEILDGTNIEDRGAANSTATNGANPPERALFVVWNMIKVPDNFKGDLAPDSAALNPPYQEMRLEMMKMLHKLRPTQVKATKRWKMRGNTLPSEIFDKIVSKGQEGIVAKFKCFTGDTKISLLSGEEVKIIDLVGKNFSVYSYDFDSNRIVPGTARNCRKTGSMIPILKITLDNREVIRCTYYHRFLMKNRRYIEAKDLKFQDSIMPLYRRVDFKWPYEELLQPNGNWEYTHRVVSLWKRLLEKWNTAHHRDFVKSNNSPSNIFPIKWYDHTIYHSKLVNNFSRWVKTDEGIAHQKRISNEAANNGLFWSQSREGKEWLANFNKTSGISQIRANKGELWLQTKNGKKYLTENNPNKTLEGRNRVSEMSKGLWKTPGYDIGRQLTRIKIRVNKCLQKYGVVTEETYDSIKTSGTRCYEKALELLECDNLLHLVNHKITSIEADGYEDVYDFEVDTYHNFALTSGVFVHNSGGAGYLKHKVETELKIYPLQLFNISVSDTRSGNVTSLSVDGGPLGTFNVGGGYGYDKQDKLTKIYNDRKGVVTDLWVGVQGGRPAKPGGIPHVPQFRFLSTDSEGKNKILEDFSDISFALGLVSEFSESFELTAEVQDMLMDFSKKFKLWTEADVDKFKPLDKEDDFMLRRWADEYGAGEIENHEMKRYAVFIKDMMK